MKAEARAHGAGLGLVSLLAALAVVGCHGETSTISGPEGLEPAFGKPDCAADPSHPKCGGDDGGGGDGGFTGGNVTSSFASGHAITGDGDGDYVTIKKKGALSSTLESNKHDLQVNSASNRSVCVHFPADGNIGSAADWQDFQNITGAVPGGAPLCTIVTHHTRDNTDLLTMVDGETRVTGGKLVLKAFEEPGNSWTWRLIYDDGKAGGPNDNGVCVSFDGASWTLFNDPSDPLFDPVECSGVDDKVHLFRLDTERGGFIWVATFTMTFRETLTP